MSRLDLHVPFAEKDEAKALGARWDAAARRWYVPPGLDQTPFARWLEPRPEKRREAPDFSDVPFTGRCETIADGQQRCWSCSRPTPVCALYGGADEDGRSDHLSSVVRVDDALSEILKTRPHFRLAYSRTMEAWAYANLCSHCGALQGDFFLHMEPDGAFFAAGDPGNRQGIAWITLPMACQVAEQED